MKISILQKNLKRGVAIVSHITSKNVNLPILNNIKIEVSDKCIKLIATNLEIGVTHIIRGKVDKEGVVIVDSKILSNYISLLPNKQVDIESFDKHIHIHCDNYKTTLHGQQGDDFPLLPVIDKENEIVVKADSLKKALSQVIFAVSTNESRIDLSGVLFILEDKEMCLVATDSYRLAERRMSLEKPLTENKRLIVPSKTVQEVIRILSSVSGEDDAMDEQEEVRIYISDNQIMFKIGSTELISRLIEGQFPDYKQVIPTKINTEVLIEKSEIVRATKAASLFSKNDVNDIILDFPENKNKLIVSSSSGQVGENVIELKTNVHGVDNSLSLNYKYFLDGLGNVDGDRVRIEVVDKNSPCLIKPENIDNYLYIIMPIKK